MGFELATSWTWVPPLQPDKGLRTKLCRPVSHEGCKQSCVGKGALWDKLNICSKGKWHLALTDSSNQTFDQYIWTQWS